MKIDRVDDNDGQTILRVESDWAAIAADYDDVVSAYSRVQIPGFRPGKVPRSVIEQRLQKEIIEELSQRAAYRMGREALRESGEESLGPVEVGDIECAKGRSFRFVARFWPMPVFELPDLGALAVTHDGSDIRDQISRRLLEMVPFAVPDDVVQAELDGAEGSGPEERKAAADRVRLMLILKKIAGREGIEVSEKDVEQRIKEKAREFGLEVDDLKAEIEGGDGRQRLKGMLLAESTLDHLLEISTQKKGDAR